MDIKQETKQKALAMSLATVAVQVATAAGLYFFKAVNDPVKLLVLVVFAGVGARAAYHIVWVVMPQVLINTWTLVVLIVLFMAFASETVPAVLWVIMGLYAAVFINVCDAHLLREQSRGAQEPVLPIFFIMAGPQFILLFLAAMLLQGDRYPGVAFPG